MLSLEEERVVYSQALESLFYCPSQLVLTQCFLSSPLEDLIHLPDSEEGLLRVLRVLKLLMRYVEHLPVYAGAPGKSGDTYDNDPVVAAATVMGENAAVFLFYCLQGHRLY